MTIMTVGGIFMSVADVDCGWSSPLCEFVNPVVELSLTLSFTNVGLINDLTLSGQGWIRGTILTLESLGSEDPQ